MALVTDFRRFDVVDADPSDHFYFKYLSVKKVGDDESIFLPDDLTSQSTFTTKAKFDAIMRERKQLEEYTPGSIFIRAYKCEISLLRAAIVGVPGTPYHNFLFFFDICLPTNYPSIPPMIRYKGFQVADVNPNLGFCGEILLRSLKDVSGKPSIRWNPESSTLLQRLLAIQALVFAEKPYYNRPFHVPFAGKNTRERWAAEYNDKVLQRCCVLTKMILKWPPKNFEDLVATHFRQRGLDILTALVSCRERMTHKGYSELVMALAKNGAPVAHFVVQVEAEKKSRELAEKNEKKVIHKLSKMFSKNQFKLDQRCILGFQVMKQICKPANCWP